MADAPPPPRAPARTSGQRDLTQGPIGRTLALFALPVLGSSVLQSLNGSINAIWVGRLLGETGLTATVNANNILFLLFATVFGVGMAATILIGQAYGRRDVAEAKKVVGTLATFFLGVSLALAVVGWLTAEPMLRALDTPPAAQAMAVTYLRIVFLALPPMYLLAFLMMALRGAGDSRTPFRFMAVATAFDVVLNPLFIAGWGPVPALGIAGAAVATLVSQSVGLVALVAWLYHRRFELTLARAELGLLRPDPVLLRAAVTKGLPMGLQMIVISLSGLVMVGVVNGYGADTTAAYGVAVQLWGYVVMPALAIGAAASSVAAQNVGAGLWRRVDRTARAGVAINIGMTGALILLIYAAQGPLAGLFLPGHPEAVAVVERINAAGLWAYLMLGVSFVVFAVVRATGAVWPPLIILSFTLLGVRVPLTLWMERSMGADAVWWSFPVSVATAMVLSVLYYRYGGWRRASMLARSTVERGPALAEPAQA